jgi:hypothetical protein
VSSQLGWGVFENIFKTVCRDVVSTDGNKFSVRIGNKKFNVNKNSHKSTYQRTYLEILNVLRHPVVVGNDLEAAFISLGIIGGKVIANFSYYVKEMFEIEIELEEKEFVDIVVEVINGESRPVKVYEWLKNNHFLGPQARISSVGRIFNDSKEKAA